MKRRKTTEDWRNFDNKKRNPSRDKPKRLRRSKSKRLRRELSEPGRGKVVRTKEKPEEKRKIMEKK